MTSRRSARLDSLRASENIARRTSAKDISRRPVSRGPENGIRKKKDAKGTSMPADSKRKADFVAPATPRRRGRQASQAIQIPFTPTPSIVKSMNVPYSSGDIDDSTPPPPPNRAADPHHSNALLRTPQHSHIVAYANGAPDVSPSKRARGITTTRHLLDEACAHLIKVDPKMKPLIDRHYCRIFSVEGLAEEIDPFRSLTSGIIAQQVSGAAAKAIKNRFVALFNEESFENQHDEQHVSSSAIFPTPRQVVACDLERLKTAGLSGRKAEYIKGLAEKFSSGELTAEMLVNGSDEEVLEKLIAVRGLGRWSVEMFMCFALKRLDVFSTGDLGVQRGMAAFMGKDVSKLKAKGGKKWKYMSESDMIEHSSKFAPYRSLFMWYMWRAEDVDVSAVQDNAD